MLKIDKLTFGYGHSKRKVLDDFAMELAGGTVCGLLGPNGAGKTTLLQLIMGALTPWSGTVTFDGENTRARKAETLSRMMLVPEEVTLPEVSLDTFIDCYGRMYPNFSKEIFDECVKEFMVEDKKNLKALSMGQKKKIYISFALACRCDLILMDEPTNGLDIPGKASFRRLISSLIGDDTTVIISTHQVRDLEQILDRIAIMDEHRLLFNQTVGDIQNRLKFVWNIPQDQAMDALATMPSPAGVDAMLINDGEGEETSVNLEMLFDYVLRHPQDTNKIFNGTEK